jgi:hypothetical protein
MKDDDTFVAACRKADAAPRKTHGQEDDTKLKFLRRRLRDDVSLERAWHELDDRRGKEAAAATVEALMFSLRERGVAALAEPQTRRRLGELSEAQLHEVCTRLQNLKIARTWADAEIEQLAVAWNARHA